MLISVAGYGVSGRAAERLGLLSGHEVTIVDERNSNSADEIDFTGSDLIVMSPGIPPESELYRSAVQASVPIVSELEFGFRYCRFPLLAVTGTNGKTTTTELTATLLRAAGYKAEECGNIGVPLSELVSDHIKRLREVDVGVVEVSSFQLERVETFAPKAGVILNISEDHLNRYSGCMNEYAATKFRLFERINSDSAKILGESLKNTPELMPPKYLPLLKNSSDFHVSGNLLLFRDHIIAELDSLGLKGRHNLENIIAALALVEAFCGPETVVSESVLDALKAFRPGHHRLETVSVSDQDVTYIDDSKGTNPAAVTAALEAVGGNQNVCLLIGGLDKGMDFSPLREYTGQIKKAFILGECRAKVYDTLKNSFPCEKYESFEAAVNAATDNAESGDVVLLSPGCASMDMFKNYRERGEKFTALVTK